MTLNLGPGDLKAAPAVMQPMMGGGMAGGMMGGGEPSFLGELDGVLGQINSILGQYQNLQGFVGLLKAKGWGITPPNKQQPQTQAPAAVANSNTGSSGGSRLPYTDEQIFAELGSLIDKTKELLGDVPLSVAKQQLEKNRAMVILQIAQLRQKHKI